MPGHQQKTEPTVLPDSLIWKTAATDRIDSVERDILIWKTEATDANKGTNARTEPFAIRNNLNNKVLALLEVQLKCETMLTSISFRIRLK